MTDHTRVIRAYQQAVAECSGRSPEDVLTDPGLRGMLLYCAFHDAHVPFYSTANFCRLPWNQVVAEAHLASDRAEGIATRIRTTAQAYLDGEAVK